MNMLIAYGTVAIFFVLVVFILEKTKKDAASYNDYAVASRSFGPWFQTMSFLNTWLPGSIFTAFAGFAAAAGVIGFYVVSYSLLAILMMFFMAERIHTWGQVFELRTQADFVGMRYGSKAVRVVAALIGVVCMFPWLILGLQSVGLVFSYLSFGRVSPTAAIFIGIGVLALRQVWTVRLGMRGVVVSDMVQGIAAYGIGFCIAVGMIVWLIGHGHGFDKLPPEFATLPGSTSAVGQYYYLSIVVTGALGAWCWPDIFVRLFTAKSTAAIKRSALQAGPLLFLFCGALLLMSMLASSYPSVASATDNVWFLTTAMGGPLVIALAGVCVLAATMGNVAAVTAAVGTQLAQDVIHVSDQAVESDEKRTRTARQSALAVSVLAVAGAMLTINTTTGLVTLAMTSYQGIVQLAPALYLGIFWRRGTAAGALAGMVGGFAVATALQFAYPTSIPFLGGLTSGVVGMLVNVALYVGIALVAPLRAGEKVRVDYLFDQLVEGSSLPQQVAVTH